MDDRSSPAPSKPLPCPFCGSDPMQRGGRLQCDNHTYSLNVDDWNDRIYPSPSAAPYIPLSPTREMIEAGAQRLVRWETGNEKWPDSWSELDVRAARNDAERCWRSMWLAAHDGPPITTDEEPPAPRSAERHICPENNEPCLFECTGGWCRTLFGHTDRELDAFKNAAPQDAGKREHRDNEADRLERPAVAAPPSSTRTYADGLKDAADYIAASTFAARDADVVDSVLALLRSFQKQGGYAKWPKQALATDPTDSGGTHGPDDSCPNCDPVRFGVESSSEDK